MKPLPRAPRSVETPPMPPTFSRRSPTCQSIGKRPTIARMRPSSRRAWLQDISSSQGW